MNAPFELFPLQQEALAMLRQSLRAGHKRPVLQAPTGFGKTVLGAHIVAGALAKGNRIAFVVPMINLIDQTFERFHENGIDPADMGVMQGDHRWRRPHAPVQIWSAQTLARRRFPEVDLAIVDECHMRFDVIEDWMAERPDMIFVGLSATPWSAGMADCWSDLIVPTSISELIAVGRLSPFRVRAPSHPRLDGVKTVAGDYHERQLSERMSEPKLVADVVSTWLEAGRGQPTLCFAVDRAHARLLAEQFASDGVNVAYIDAYTDREERLAIAAKFKHGAVKVIVSVGTMTTGIGLDVRSLILARPPKSEILFTQIIGRALRTAPGKDFATILDHSDSHIRLGFVTDLGRDVLKPGKPSSTAAKRKEKQPATPIECPSCLCLIPVGTAECPACCFAPRRACKIVCEDDELVEIGKTGKTAKPKRDATGEVDFIRQLRRYARKNEYAPGWVPNKFREKFGVWPNSPSLKYSGEGECGPIVRSWIRSRNIAFRKATETSRTARSDEEALADAS